MEPPPPPPPNEDGSLSTCSSPPPQQRKVEERPPVVQASPFAASVYYAGKDDEEEDEGTSFWAMFFSVYLPFLFLWVRRSMFGTANLLQSLVLGQALRLVFVSSAAVALPIITPPPWISEAWEKLCRQVSFSHSFNNKNGAIMMFANNKGSSSQSSAAWPPPALTALAVLTIVAFVVHPDGLTWIMLGKLRDGVLAFFETSPLCIWFLQEDGAVSALAVTTILASLALLWGLLLHGRLKRRVTPSTRGSHGSKAQAKHKKRGKKGKHPQRGGGGRGRIRGGGNYRSPKPVVQESSPSLPSKSPPPAPDNDPHERFDTLVDPPQPPPQEPQPARSRIMSSSTVDLMISADDGSCCSSSVLSTASAPLLESASSSTTQSTEESSRNTTRTRRKNRRNTRKSVQSGKESSRLSSSSPTANKARTRGKLATTTTTTSPKQQAQRPSRTTDARARLASTNNASNPTASFRRDPGNTQPAPSTLLPPLIPALSSPPPLYAHAIPERQPSIYPATTTMTRDTAFRYNVPNYAGSYSYSSGAAVDGRYTPGKMELAAFLAQVGLMGAACADLLRDLADVDALATLTDEQYGQYRIWEKRALIDAMLEARRRRQEYEKQQQQQQWNAMMSVLPPPPGLTAPSVAPSNIATVAITQAPFGRESSMLPPMCTAMPPVSHQQPIIDPVASLMKPPERYPPVLTSLSAFGQASAMEAPFGAYFGPTVEASLPPEDDGDSSRIEAELQELGGQMVGSILDF